MADLTAYTGLITSEHNQRPKFMAVVEALTKPMVDLMNVLGSMPDKFDLDQAVGVQLDDVGRWVGISRIIRTPLTNVYFSLDIDGLGFDQGIWKGPFDPDTGLTTLDDDTYRLVIRAKIGANHWDGTMESTVAILNSIFSPGGELQPQAVQASGELFGVGDGARTQFQLLYQGQPVYKVNSATLYRNDWQGNQKLYPTPRTNMVLWSQDFSNAYWSKTRSTAIPNAGVAPDGTNTATKLVEDTSNNTHPLLRTISVPADTWNVWSVFVKAAERSVALIQIGNFAAQVAPNAVYVNLATGEFTATDLTRTQVTPLADGWYKVSTKIQTNSSGVSVQPSVYPAAVMGSATYQGDGSSGILVWGGYFENGSEDFKSYFATEGSAVTLTDYTLGSTGIATLATPPVTGAALTWTGDGEIYPSGTYVFIQDNQDMTMTIGIAGKVPSAVFLALLEGGYIPLKPEGVRVNFTVVTTVEGSPLFGFDVNNPYASGFDVGAWGRLL